jgi:hypothetical protein
MFARLFPLNEHPVDRVLRIALGIGLLTLTVVGPRTLWGLLGIIPLVTGDTRQLPAVQSARLQHLRARAPDPLTGANPAGVPLSGAGR